MTVHFHVLASGSSGNCSLLEIDELALMIDLGLGPRQLASRIDAKPPVWERVRAALLTHVHTDHWNENTFNHFTRRRVPLYCHAEHATALRKWSAAFAALADAGLVRLYEQDTPFAVEPGCHCQAIPLAHDGGATFGFRIEGSRDLFNAGWAVAYAADLGSWDTVLAGRFADVDVLALEFNHDVALQFASGRSPQLIRRVLGDQGHLSNAQAAALFAEVLRRSAPGRIKHLVQLHLSRQCNRGDLAHEAAHTVVSNAGATLVIHTAQQHVAGPRIGLAETIQPAEFVDIG
jgi:phosphoribosyl 1,2-cyclic phosphodiesterase